MRWVSLFLVCAWLPHLPCSASALFLMYHPWASTGGLLRPVLQLSAIPRFAEALASRRLYRGKLVSGSLCGRLR